MQKQEIHQYLEHYFTANQCDIVENGGCYLTVQLSARMDKELMNRPFYWHYIEKTGGSPAPMKVTFITDQQQISDSIKGEIIHYGSPRLHQIFQSTKKLSRYIRLYETRQQQDQQRQLPLHPWLCLNLKISFQADRKRDQFRSLGLNLIHGQVVENFHDYVLSKELTPKIPDLSFTLIPMIKPLSGILRLEKYLRNEFSAQSHGWAEEAMKRWKDDLTLLDHFYEDQEEKPESYYTEKQALKEQYEPKISVHIINGGIFYLKVAKI
ncbi:hypothetical protein J2S13_000245 [Oikeobacillus pervagus]|uniref:YqhG n=1 Tax=Oikeobacillus pervagus TaxID=1325931 RepID=A0AAJ1SYW8_9BACI|nr:YqhG family protein [Oikeobacillus pervagus]MDQ0213851.1 hypothetical protein [Oikeobacillus pervagus]